MCQPAKCPNCQKTTWSGCGQHVEQVMGNVPKDRRCRCTAAEKAAAKKPSFISRLLNR